MDTTVVVVEEDYLVMEVEMVVDSLEEVVVSLDILLKRGGRGMELDMTMVVVVVEDLEEAVLGHLQVTVLPLVDSVVEVVLDQDIVLPQVVTVLVLDTVVLQVVDQQVQVTAVQAVEVGRVTAHLQHLSVLDMGAPVPPQVPLQDIHHLQQELHLAMEDLLLVLHQAMVDHLLVLPLDMVDHQQVVDFQVMEEAVEVEGVDFQAMVEAVEEEVVDSQVMEEAVVVVVAVPVVLKYQENLATKCLDKLLLRYQDSNVKAYQDRSQSKSAMKSQERVANRFQDRAVNKFLYRFPDSKEGKNRKEFVKFQTPVPAKETVVEAVVSLEVFLKRTREVVVVEVQVVVEEILHTMLQHRDLHIMERNNLTAY